MVPVGPEAGCSRADAPLSPHTAQPSADINPHRRQRHRRVASRFGGCCGTPSEQGQDVVGQEPRAWRDRVAAAEAMLVGAEEAQWLDQMKMLLGTGDGDIEETALFID